MDIKKCARLSMFTSLAIILNILESFIPLDVQSTVCNLVSKALESVYKYKFSAFFET